jgi:hypothetical protein
MSFWFYWKLVLGMGFGRDDVFSRIWRVYTIENRVFIDFFSCVNFINDMSFFY